jgi:tetratricopeptide (TPR) repeat protein
MIFVPEVLMRFGRWEEILEQPEPAENLPYSRAMWRFTRAVALTAMNRMDEAEREREVFRTAAAQVPEDWEFGNNKCSDLLAVATNMLDGEMAAQYEDFDAAVTSLEKAIAIEDTLRYDEPPDWIQPVRHTLGAVLLRAGRYAEAEAVYREDLARYPENGWSLFGLSRALRLQQKDDAAETAEARFAKAWSGADIKMTASCLCQPPV